MISIKNFFQNRNKKHEDWSSRSSFATISSIDYSVIAVILALLILGLIMVYSASISLGDSPKYQTSEGYFAVRHAIYIVIGLMAAFFVFKVPLSRWYPLSYPLGLFGILLLISVFVPGLGHEVNGSTRWIGFGPINLQVSEVVKFVSVLVISHFVVTRQAYMHSYTRGLIPVMLYIGAVAMLLSLQPDLGATVVISAIIYDVKCTRRLVPWIKEHGGIPTICRTGHSLVKAKLKETQAPFAGEMSGHLFFNDQRWPGFDDGLYAGARMLEILSRTSNPSDVLEALPTAVNTPELHIEMQEGENKQFVERLQKELHFNDATDVITIDGIRVEWEDGFALARSSNTTPVVVLRLEGDTPEALERIKTRFGNAIKEIYPSVVLPF